MFPGTPPGLPNTILGVSWWSGKRPRKKILVPTRKRPRPPAWRPRPFAFRSSGAGQGGAEPHRSGEAASRNRSRISTRSGAVRQKKPRRRGGAGIRTAAGPFPGYGTRAHGFLAGRPGESIGPLPERLAAGGVGPCCAALRRLACSRFCHSRDRRSESRRTLARWGGGGDTVY